MPTVWAVHDVRDDISPALGFGPIRFINDRYVNGDELEQDPAGWVLPHMFRRRMHDAATEFNPNDDYLLIAGDHLQLLAFTAILFGRFNSIFVLRYDRRLGEYIPIQLNSGIVNPPAPVLGSDHIGDDHHGESRNRIHPVCEYCEKSHDTRLACPEYVRAGIEAPLARRGPAQYYLDRLHGKRP